MKAPNMGIVISAQCNIYPMVVIVVKFAVSIAILLPRVLLTLFSPSLHGIFCFLIPQGNETYVRSADSDDALEQQV
ncbi:hypothetical protein K456DRAFT_52330 [Colletotrichum gloeosporioides 23]|nr:hypothetical protein K456DRAFT_52330 [Colletotrichum gloeosporioides 23]